MRSRPPSRVLGHESWGEYYRRFVYVIEVRSSSSITRSNCMQPSVNPLTRKHRSSIPCQSTVLVPTLAAFPYRTSRNSANLRTVLSPFPINSLYQSVRSLFRVYFDGTERENQVNRPFRKFVGGTGRLIARSEKSRMFGRDSCILSFPKNGRVSQVFLLLLRGDGGDFNLRPDVDEFYAFLTTELESSLSHSARSKAPTAKRRPRDIINYTCLSIRFMRATYWVQVQFHLG